MLKPNAAQQLKIKFRTGLKFPALPAPERVCYCHHKHKSNWASGGSATSAAAAALTCEQLPPNPSRSQSPGTALGGDSQHCHTAAQATHYPLILLIKITKSVMGSAFSCHWTQTRWISSAALCDFGHALDLSEPTWALCLCSQYLFI